MQPLFQVIVCTAIADSQNKVLIAQRGLNKKLGGKWEFPGGKLEHGEELIDGLKREIREELTIEIDQIELITIKPFLYNFGAVLILFYSSRWASGQITLVDHEQYDFISLDEIDNYDLLPANRDLVSALKSHRN